MGDHKAPSLPRFTWWVNQPVNHPINMIHQVNICPVNWVVIFMNHLVNWVVPLKEPGTFYYDDATSSAMEGLRVA